jgi:methyl-accepting chemotaxis protein
MAILAVVAVISLVLAFYISGLISKPLKPLSAFMAKAGATGDITLTQYDLDIIGNYSNNKDEIGQTISAIADFVGRISYISQEMETVAGGDLSRDVTLLSENDVMGSSLRKMVENLNIMFEEIHSAASQVSTGSKQIADGAQSLAQGATEQAASMEELSHSIIEISTKTKENAETAGKTSKLSNTIKESAEKGSRQMDEMITAVKDINDASQSISKIIKTIDDIAFQTNILALNAAVEAARAGQHGKGFAVVAEEVRNLASKSAEAAKDTGDMIQNSMEKAEFGSRIAGETAASLTEIVEGIKESSNLIGEIAKSSEEQSMGISQINSGIDQVAQVVQQNSATAEESAAASEEMSGQSNLLQQLISEFKLKGR